MKKFITNLLTYKLAQLHIFFIILVSVLLFFFIDSCFSNTLDKHIFIISSYHKNDPCSFPQYEAVIEALQHSNIGHIQFNEYFLNARQDDEKIINQKIKLIKDDILLVKPKIIVTIDDFAFSSFYEFVMDIPHTYLVFSGLNKSISFYNDKKRFVENNKPIKNITGVYEYLFIKEQLMFIEKLVSKKLNKVALLYSEDQMGPITVEQLINEIKNSKYENIFVLYSVKTIEDVINACNSINDNAEIDAWIPAAFSINSKGNNILMVDISKIMVNSIQKPDLSLNASFTKYGFLGGVSVDQMVPSLSN